ncbi:MAG: nucleoside transporter, partial [Verrucomicrobiae bacterium]|nr:nucleoside transporter [Verrucomicrobiae bacterium]
GELGFWHVAAFAWICNLAMHGGLSDMTILRFARKYQYGYFAALGMFIGHFMAWICAGIMGAGAAMLLQTTVPQLDAGAVAFQALGAAGIITVIIAGWTTSNPTIYRAGLAFQSLNPAWDRTRVTVVVGVVTTVIACFPFVFSKLMDFVGLMGLLLVPVAAVLFTEHWIFPLIGKTRYWAKYRQLTTNRAAVISWASALLIAFVLHAMGLHLCFLLV